MAVQEMADPRVWVALGLAFFARTRGPQFAQATSAFGVVLASAQAEA